MNTAPIWLCTAGLLLSTPALAQEDPSLDGVAQEDSEESESGDDELDDLLTTPGSSSRRGEKEDLREESSSFNQPQNKSYVPPQRTIKTIQEKDFMKLGRFEATPSVGFVTNDPFLNRYIAGARLGYHITEIFAVEAEFSYSPDLGTRDWKPLTHQLVEENNVSPDISKLTLISNATFQFSPIYGKVALGNGNIIHFDIYGAFGMGVTQTRDDLEALQAIDDPIAQATEVQLQPTTNFGGGVRVSFNETVALRIDGRSLVYIETVNSTTLEMKNNFILSGGVGFFFPSMEKVNQ
ncbi:MAG: outer membrane beta-barrel domain-containing protein [Myxococcota bacterium]|nr:outer membrane beta-barrel domain-containing protein [Myxococcota bacterium]